MARVPAEFEEEFNQKGKTFFAIAELLYSTPDRQYTQDELAERFDCSNQTISTHTTEMSEWLDRRDGQTTYAWDVDVHDPGHTESTMAAKRFYADLWHLLVKHSNTVPGVLALLGFVMLLAAAVTFSYYLGFVLEVFAASGVPANIYLGIGFVFLLTGGIVTFFSPYVAWLSGILWPRLLGNYLYEED